MERQEVIQKAKDDRKRIGKTQKDHESGAWARRLQNQQARGAWSQSLAKGGSGKHSEPFPTHTCNGHRYYRGAGKKAKGKVA